MGHSLTLTEGRMRQLGADGQRHAQEHAESVLEVKRVDKRVDKFDDQIGNLKE